jgi:hypothetical protein
MRVGPSRFRPAIAPGAFLAAAGAALLAWTAAGATDLDNSEYSTKETRAIMHAYARCVVKRQPRKASEAILADLSQEEILHHYGSLIIGDCLANAGGEGTQMSFKGDLYTYALADALVARELADVPPPALDGVPVLVHREPGAEPRPTDARGKRLRAGQYSKALDNYRRSVVFAFLSKYGECIVRFAPPEAKALLTTAPDSVEETAAFGRLRPALSNCMPVGRTISFGRVALRGGIAINYYRLAHAAGAGEQAMGRREAGK